MSRRRTGNLRTSVLVGVVVALLLASAGAFYAFSQQRSWVAESMVVVLPSADLDEATSASYYETLSRGQIVATFAEVAGTQGFEQQAEDQLGLSPADRSLVSTEVSVVPDTAVILIRSTAGDAQVAQQISRVTTALSVRYLEGLTQPFRVVTVPSGSAAEPTGMSPWVLAAAGLMAGLVAGLAVQQAVYHLSAAVRGPRVEPQPMSPEPAEGAVLSSSKERSSTGSDRMTPAEEDSTAAARRSVPTAP